MGKTIDLRGRKFGRLTVVELAAKIDHHTRWLCKCDCGKDKIARYQCLVKGQTTSCGCRNSEVAAARNRTHGNAIRGKVTSEYRSWFHMVERCRNPLATAYSKYGAKGITYHPEWDGENGFANFLAYMGPKPTSQHTVDRIDGAGNYVPGNVKWSSKKEQSINRKTTRLFELNGETLCIADWARKFNINRRTLTRRLTERNLTLEQALHEAGITKF